MNKTKILFVCMGNICRSPTAHGVFESMLEQTGIAHVIEVDSAGTHAYHVGDPPDSRAQDAAERRGYRLEHLRARKVDSGDFLTFDHILAMDQANYRHLTELAGPEHQHKIRLFMDFAEDLPESEVPDPYYGGPKGFDRVLDMIEAASAGLIAALHRAELEHTD